MITTNNNQPTTKIWLTTVTTKKKIKIRVGLRNQGQRKMTKNGKYE